MTLNKKVKRVFIRDVKMKFSPWKIKATSYDPRNWKLDKFPYDVPSFRKMMTKYVMAKMPKQYAEMHQFTFKAVIKIFRKRTNFRQMELRLVKGNSRFRIYEIIDPDVSGYWTINRAIVSGMRFLPNRIYVEAEALRDMFYNDPQRFDNDRYAHYRPVNHFENPWYYRNHEAWKMKHRLIENYRGNQRRKHLFGR
jgi:hypothetical protein